MFFFAQKAHLALEVEEEYGGRHDAKTESTRLEGGPRIGSREHDVSGFV